MSRLNPTSPISEGNRLFDTRSENGSTISLPPSYHSREEGSDEKKDWKEPEVDVRPIQFLKKRATTFSSITGREVKDKYGQAKRFITRSGTGLPEIQIGDPIVVDNKKRSFNGWRGGVLAAVTSAGVVLLVNICFTIWAAITSKSGTNIGIIWEAPCETIHTADLWIHIVVNILGTVLLGSSNYTMQCLSSPTRGEVDEAHSVGSYLDIGLPSFKNLRGWRKKSLFGLLVTSTIPLHFLWNSAVFTTTQRLDHQVYVVTPNFFKASEVDCSQNVSMEWPLAEGGINNYFPTPLAYNFSNYSGWPYDRSHGNSNTSWYEKDRCSIANALLRNATQGTLQRLSNEECIKEYGGGAALLSHKANLLVVTKSQPVNKPNATVLLDFRYEVFVSKFTGNNWVCDPAYLNSHKGECNYKEVAKTANTDWTLGSFEPTEDNLEQFPVRDRWPIDHCLAQPSDLGGMCKLQYSLIIMICVIVANMVKFSVILYFLRNSIDPVLATIGDGIATFLERPDPITANRPFLNRKAARKFRLSLSSSGERYHERKRPLRWWHAPSFARWSITLVLCFTAIIATSVLLRQGANINNAWSSGFGNYNQYAVLNIGLSLGSNDGSDDLRASDFDSNSILIAMVTVANIPQVLVSCLYFAYNTVYTSMVSADEWSRFTTHRKTLRTTDPAGMQRSTYWLSLPWTYALPLAAASSFLHWLISQALFVARTEVLDTTGQPESVSYMEVGYSPMAILMALLFGTAMVLVMVINGARKLKGGILVGNNSLAISAACQRPEKDTDAHLRPVKWGALESPDGDHKGAHCCFTSREVELPREGQLYI